MYYLNFTLMHHYKYSLTELENLIPYERDVYVDMLKDYIEQMKQQQQQQ